MAALEIILAHDHYDARRLEGVIAEMEELGAPTIKAVEAADGRWIAFEGCHRLRAALALGLTPAIEEVEYSDEIMVEDVGIDTLADPTTTAELADRLYDDYLEGRTVSLTFGE